MEASKQVSIIVPTYREALNIPHLVERVSCLLNVIDTLELIIVDDHSQDGTIAAVQQLAHHYPWLKLIERKKKPSLSWSVLEGCQEASYATIVVMDADLSHPPERIPDMLAALSEPGVEFVIGSRYIKNGSTDEKWPVPRRLTSHIAAGMARMLLTVNVRDPLSGFICFRHTSLDASSHLNPIGWKIGLELMVKCHMKHIREIPIHFSQRMLGKSKLTMKVVLVYLAHVVRLGLYKLKPI